MQQQIGMKINTLTDALAVSNVAAQSRY